MPVNLAPDKLYVEAVEKVNLDRIRRSWKKMRALRENQRGTLVQRDIKLDIG
jgi:hypothetical protein